MKEDRTMPKSVGELEAAYRARQSRARKRRRAEPWNWIERERVVAVMKAWVEREDANASTAKNSGNHAKSLVASHSVASVSARDRLANDAGFARRTVYRIMSGRVTSTRRAHRFNIEGGELFLSIDTVDRLFLAMDCAHLFHVDPSFPGATDGFADVYRHPGLLEADEADDLDVVLLAEATSLTVADLEAVAA